MVIIDEHIHMTLDEVEKTVDKISLAYANAMKNRAIDERRIRISVEEILLNVRAAVGDNHECEIVLKTDFGKLRLEIITKGSEFDITGESGEMYDSMNFSNEILQMLDVAPKYEHSNANGGTNKVSIVFGKQPSKNRFLYLMLIAVAVAVAAYFIVNICFSEDTVTTITKISSILFEKSVAIIAAVATPLIFFSVITGIVGLGDVHTFGQIGKRVVGEMLLTYLLSGLLFGIFGSIVYYTGGSGGVGEGVLYEIFELILDMVPNNMMEPFRIDNDLQVITIAIFSGFIMLLVYKSMPVVRKANYELSTFFNKMMEVACKLLPLIVFLGIFNMLVSDEVKEVLKIYKAVLIILGVALIIMGILTLRTLIVTKLSFKSIIKKQLPAFLVTLTTSSQVAAIPENMTFFKEKMGINSKFVDFAFPLSIVIYMPCGAAFLGITAMSLAYLAGISITVSTIIKIVVVSVIIAIAAPPIPGSAFAVMPIVFAACGVPNSVYPIAIVLGTVIGYLLPALNCYCLQHKILVTAFKLGQVDTEVLYSEE